MALLVLPVLSLLNACGGGGGGSSAAPPATTSPPLASTWTPGTFPSSSEFKNLCEVPRTGNQYPDLQGSSTDENYWLRSWSNELYLWYDEIVDRDPTLYTTPGYFQLLKTNAQTASGASKDRFHFTIPTDEYLALSQSGVSVGYGARFELISAAPPRKVTVAYVDPFTPASAAGLLRGTDVVAINGQEVATTSDVALLNRALFPDDDSQSFNFTLLDQGASSTRSVTMTPAIVTSDPVNEVSIIDTPAGLVGYISFTEHIATSEAQLVNAIQQLDAASVTDLILDLRYNSGGFLDIANELAFMIAGPSAASGRVFDEIQFNDKHPTRNPVTGQILEPDYFLTTTQGFSTSSGTPLPSLNLNRVFVLTGSATCSASETIINGLRGIDIEVIQVGATTCGKPYGFYAFDNCGTSYFSIQFRGVNAKGFGDYTDGFSPANLSTTQGVSLPGCAVVDDFSHPLGDVSEARLAAAINYRATGSCPVSSMALNNGIAFDKPASGAAAESAVAADVGAIERPQRPGLVKLR